MATAFNTRKRIRRFFGHIESVAPMPNLIEVQKSSYESFLQRVTPNAQLSVRVENVFNKKYSEFGDVPQRAVFERTFYVSLACTL